MVVFSYNSREYPPSFLRDAVENLRFFFFMIDSDIDELEHFH